MGIGVHLIDLFLVVLLLKQKLKLEFFLVTIVSFDLIDFMFLVVLLKQKLKLEFFCNNFKLWFDWFHVSSSSCVVETKIEAWIFFAMIIRFHLIDCMFLVVVLLKQKLKLQFFGNNFKLWFDWFHVSSSSCVVETKIEAWIFLATIVSFDLFDFMFLVVVLK
jgi:hypothetical protein